MRKAIMILTVLFAMTTLSTANAAPNAAPKKGPCVAPTCLEVARSLKKARGATYRARKAQRKAEGSVLSMRTSAKAFKSGILAGKAEARAAAQAEAGGYKAGLTEGKADVRVGATGTTATGQLGIMKPVQIAPAKPSALPSNKTAPVLAPAFTNPCGALGVKRFRQGARFNTGNEHAQVDLQCNEPVAVNPMVSQTTAKEIKSSKKMHLGWKLLIGVGTTGAMAAAGWGIGDEVNPAEYNQATGDYTTGSGGAGLAIGLASGAVLNAVWIVATELAGK